MLNQVSTGMGDHLWAGMVYHLSVQTSQQSQLSLASLQGH